MDTAQLLSKSHPKIDWSSYALQYDVMARMNPAYQEILQRFSSFIDSIARQPGTRILDLGAGTGNFGLLAARRLEDSHVLLVEPNSAMSACATVKSEVMSAKNVSIQRCSVDECDFKPSSFSMIIAVHSLFAVPAPLNTLRRIHDWLIPGGHTFICDPGRCMDVGDWSRYLWGQAVSREGLWNAIRIFWSTRRVAQQNRRIGELQKRGVLWTHTHEDFVRVVESAGFTINCSAEVYRGYSDLVIAQKSNGMDRTGQSHERSWSGHQVKRFNGTDPA